MEFMSQFDAKIVYIRGKDNTIADALSWLLVAVALSSDAAINMARSPYEYCPDNDDNGTTTINTILLATYTCLLLSAHALVETDIATTQAIMAVLLISQDLDLCSTIIGGYEIDPWYKKLRGVAPGMPAVQERENLLFIWEQLVISAVGNIWESLFCLAHDSLGHFGFKKHMAHCETHTTGQICRKRSNLHTCPAVQSASKTNKKLQAPQVHFTHYWNLINKVIQWQWTLLDYCQKTTVSTAY